MATSSGIFRRGRDVGLRIRKYVVRFQLTWADSSFEQLRQLRKLLLSHKIRVSRIAYSDCWRLDIEAQKDVLRAAHSMVRFSAKKQSQLKVVIDYLENRITGSDAVERFNQAVQLGFREGKSRHASIPWTRARGKALEHKIAVKKAAEKNRVVSNEMIRHTISTYRPYGVTQAEIARRFGISRSSVERVLKGKNRRPKT